MEQPTAGELFDVLWERLAVLLGTAATATLVRRAAKGAAPGTRPTVVVKHNTLDYEYAVPESWRHAGDVNALCSLRDLSKELGVLLGRLTGTIVVDQLEREPRLRRSGISFVKKPDPR